MRCSNPTCRHGDADQAPDRFYANRERCKDCYNAACAERQRRKRRGPPVQEPAQATVPAPTAARWPSLAAFDSARWSVRGENDSEPPEPAQTPAEIRAAARAAQNAAAAERRRGSDFDPLTAGDLADEYDVSIGNQPGQGAVSAQASREKRQEYNENMGRLAEHLLDAAERSAANQGHYDITESMTAEDGAFIAVTAEQERRYGNRRVARAAAIWLSAEALQLRMLKQMVARHLADKIVPVGYGLASRPEKPARRSIVLTLSDLHLGSDMVTLDEPIPFGRVEEARRLEYVLRETIDYKPHYRANTKLVLLIIGDVIEGQLMHQIGAGAPLVEQKVITWHLLSRFIAECSTAFPEVEIHWQGGNHGRDKVRHPGRATWRKYDSHEAEIGIALRAMCSGLRNVTWSIPYKAVSSVDLHGQWLLATHGDTDVKIGPPDSAAAKNRSELDRVNSSRIFGREYAAAVFGHYHTPRMHPGKPTIIYNGMLVPPNGHARSNGWINDPCGMWLWEAVEGFPVGDARYLRVGVEQDHDEQLGKILTPCDLSNYLDVT